MIASSDLGLVRGGPPNGPPADGADSPTPRSAIGNYRLERLIGSGGMADVYEAVHAVSGQRAAVKMLRHCRENDADAHARFLREGMATARVKHPHVVSVLDYGESNGVAYLAMEYLDGWSLAELLERGPFTAERAVDLILMVIDGVSAAHDEGVIHRDLKPDNIFLVRQPDGHAIPKVVDFGISRIVDELTNRRLTHTRAVFGTPGYMPPEQFSGAKRVDEKGDQYALGVVLYEMLTGTKAFNSNRPLVEIGRAIMTSDFLRPRQVNRALPRALENAILQAMQASPGDRFDTLRAFGAAITPFASQTSQPYFDTLDTTATRRSHSWVDPSPTTDATCMPTPTLDDAEPAPDFGDPVRAHQHGAWTTEEARRREEKERAQRIRARIGKSVLVVVTAFTIASLVGLAARAFHERARNDAAAQVPAG